MSTSVPFFLLLVPLVATAGPNEAALARAAPELNRQVLRLALQAHARGVREGHFRRPTLTVIDYSLPSTERRMWVLDLKRNRLLSRELVAHGKGTGANWARRFSNESGSKKSSLGLFETLGTYRGKHGYSLKLEGLEIGFNDRAEDRAIVMHGAWYVSEAFKEKHGRLGRSWGCPALDESVHRRIIDRIKNGSAMFIYYPDDDWLERSRFLN